MAGGYPTSSPEPLAALTERLDRISARVASLEQPTGTSLSNLNQQVQAALATLEDQVAILVDEYVRAYTYTRAEIDAKIASPGAIAPTTVSASGNISSAGQVYSEQPLRSPGSRNYIATTSYVAGWINSDGTLGTVPSSLRVKKDLTPMNDDEVGSLMLSLVPRWGRYIWDDQPSDAAVTPHDDDSGEPTQPMPVSHLKAFLIAEEVDALGIYGDDVVPVDIDGLPASINYSQLVPGLIATLRYLDARLTALESPATPR